MNDRVLIGVGIVALLGVLFFPSGSSQKVKTLYEEAEQYMANSRYLEAVEKYEESLLEAEKGFVKTEVIDPDYPTLAKYKIAYAHTQQAEQTGNTAEYDSAQRILEEIYPTATVAKHREVIVFLWGYVLFKTEKLEEAEPKFRELIQNFPNSIYHENAWYSIAQLNFTLKDYDKARDAYRQIVDNFPNSDFRDDSQYRIAQTYLEDQVYEQSYREFDQMTADEFPGSPLLAEASYKAAYSLLQLDRLEEAIDRYNRFVADFPDSIFRTGAHFDLGTIYTRQGDFDNAIQNYQLAIENTDDIQLKAEIQYEIGDNYMEAENFLSAADAYNMVVETYPTTTYVDAARFGVGEAFMKEAGRNSKASGEPDAANYERAIAGYMTVLNEHPDSDYRAHSTYQIAEAYYDMKQYDNALEWFRRTQEDFPDDPLAPHALYAELWSLSELQRYDEVLARGRSFIEANADNADFDIQAAEIQTKLGDIMFEQEDFLVAAGEYERAAAYDHLPKFYATRLRSLYQIGVCYFQHAEKSEDDSFYPRGLPALTEAVEKFSDDAFDLNYEFPERIALLENSILNKANVHEKMNDWTTARDTYALIQPPSENYGRAALLSAETFEKEGNIDEAINRYRTISEDDTLTETWQSLGAIRLADLLRDQTRWAEAAAAYANVVERYPSSQHAGASQYLQGVSLYSIKERTNEHLTASIAAFQNVLDKWPDDPNAPDALYGIALSQKTLAETGAGAWEDVKASVDMLTEKYGDSGDPRAQKAVNSGNLLRVLALENLGEGSVDEIVAGLRTVANNATADAPTRVTAQLKIGNLLFEKGRLEDAVKEYRALGEMFPDSDQAPLGLYQAAVSAYKKGEEVSEENEPEARTWFQLTADLTGEALDYAGKLDNSMLVKINYTRGNALEKVGKHQEAIAALQEVANLKDDVEDPALVEAAYTKLAQLHRALGDFQAAAAEFQRLADTTANPMTKLQSFLTLADIHENSLQDIPGALAHYQAAAMVQVESDLVAQALYKAGVILYNMANQAKTDGDNDAAKAYAVQAIETFETLGEKFEGSSNTQVNLMVADAGVRASDQYTLAGKDLREAVNKAEGARDLAVQAGDVAQMIQTQYQIANLRNRYAQQIRDTGDPNKLDLVRLDNGDSIRGYIDVRSGNVRSNGSLRIGEISEETGQLVFRTVNNVADTELSYKTVSRLSAQDYVKAADFAEPFDDAPDQSMQFVGYALYQAGLISYSLHGSMDLPVAVDALQRFVDVVDSGRIEKVDAEVQDALYYVGVAYYDLARANQMSAEMFGKSAEALQSLVDRYPSADEAGLWQYQVGEAHYASQKFAEALAAYTHMANQYPNHESAPEALYSAAMCHQQLEQNGQMLAAYQRLVNAYPDHERAVDASLTLANDTFNKSIPLADDDPAKIEMLENALQLYKKVAQSSSEQAARAQSFAVETEDYLAALKFRPLDNAHTTASNSAGLAGLPASIEALETFADDFSNTSQAIVAWTRIGDGYIALASRVDVEAETQEAIDFYQKATESFGKVIARFVDSQGLLTRPSEPDQERALRYSENRIRETAPYLQKLRESLNEE